MSESYFTDDMKLLQPVEPLPLWTPAQCRKLEEALYKKGYIVNVSMCIDHNGTLCNCWTIERDLAGFFVEQLMQRRIIIEVEPRPHFRADLIFVCKNPIQTVEKLIRNMPKGEDFND